MAVLPAALPTAELIFEDPPRSNINGKAFPRVVFNAQSAQGEKRDYGGGLR